MHYLQNKIISNMFKINVPKYEQLSVQNIFIYIINICCFLMWWWLWECMYEVSKRWAEGYCGILL